MEIAAALAQEDERSTQIAASTGCIRQAEYALSIVKYAMPHLDTASLLKRVIDLKETIAMMAKERRFHETGGVSEKLRKAHRMPAPTCDPASGAIPVLRSPDMPSLKLESIAEREMAQQHRSSELVLLAAMLLFLFSYFQHGWRR